MDFELPEELKMVRSLARDFVDEQLRPLERDLLGRAADLSDARAYLPEKKEAELIGKARAVGLWSIGVPEELGGAGLGILGACLVEEELARTIVPFRPGDITPILFDGNEEQKEKYLVPALEGRKRPCLTLVEPVGGKGSPVVKVKAEDGGEYRLDGKTQTFARVTGDWFAVVFAIGETGTTCFLVDKSTPGLIVSGDVENRGWLASVREPVTLVFDNCRVPAANRLGGEGKAFYLGEKWLPQRRVVRAARSVGIAARLLEEAAVRAQSLETFGQPVGRRPAVGSALADITMNIHAGRLMVYEAAWQADNGKLTRKAAAMVKLYTTRMLLGVADNVTNIFNGPAYIEGLPMEKLCRRALAENIAELTTERQRRLVAGGILDRLKV